MSSNSHRPDEGKSPDGNKWIGLEENTKYGYIVGYVEGMFQGHCFTTWGLPGGEKPPEGAWDHATRSFDNHWKRFVPRVTYQQFFDGLNKLYSDHQNRLTRYCGIWRARGYR
jgi:hypothetical protein